MIFRDSLRTMSRAAPISIASPSGGQAGALNGRQALQGHLDGVLESLDQPDHEIAEACETLEGLVRLQPDLGGHLVHIQRIAGREGEGLGRDLQIVQGIEQHAHGVPGDVHFGGGHASRGVEHDADGSRFALHGRPPSKDSEAGLVHPEAMERLGGQVAAGLVLVPPAFFCGTQRVGQPPAKPPN